jgi:uncharacterized repeat protein (TIGR03803 family)
MLFGIKTQAQYTKLMDFAGASNGRNPQSSLFSDGTFLYGMSTKGGTNNMGTIFKIKPDGTGYLKLLDFAGTNNGRYPIGSLISDGTFLYGITNAGGTNDMGTIFKIKPDGTGYVKVYDFGFATNGSYPRSSLFYDGTFLFGMTPNGGTNGMGTIYKIKPDGTGYLKLLDFAGVLNGSGSSGPLISDGTFLYGVTGWGGTNDFGTIFKIKPDGTGYSKLLDFAGATNGRKPLWSLISDGTFLYGMTPQGGTNSLGTIFKIKYDGTGFVKLMDFAGATNGSEPRSSLITDGIYLYGMTMIGGTNNLGTIFKIKPDGTDYTKLLDFDGMTKGSRPQSSLISVGTYLYGMTDTGGINGYGTIFKIGMTVGTKDLSKNNTSINVYPNPAKTVLNIEIANNTTTSVQIIGTDGRLVKTVSNLNTTNSQINIADLSQGVYFLRIQNGAEVVTQKFVKE